MPVGTVTKYNQLEKQISADTNRQWDDATPGSIMFCLAKSTYTPAATHTTVADLGTAGVDYISTGDGAPMVATGLGVNNTTTPGVTYFSSDEANFGSSVTVTAKYLIAVQPLVANTFASTAKLLFYVDLNTTGSSSSVSSASSDFVVYTPTNGWFKIT